MVVRSTFTAETHGVIGGADGGIGLALTLHEVLRGPVSLKEAMRLTDFHGLAFKIDCITDARNLLLILKNVNMKNPAEKNFIVHLIWLTN